jgi:predicted enzyme related to lactoylglutathione lyase
VREEGRVDYIEIPVTDLDTTREFLRQLFGWEFEEWGPDYYSFNDGRLDGGLRRAETPAPASGVLLVFYSDDIDRDYVRVKELGATISQEIFEFPGGKRFHFVDPAGTEFAIWASAEEPQTE